MRIGWEIRLGIVSILLFQFVTAFGTIGLLGRMSPAIERILERNVASLTAVEDMLSVLARDRGIDDGKRRKEFQAALGRAGKNITEPAEKPLVLKIRKSHEAALAGDGDATDATVDALRSLGRVNREAMGRSDLQAKALGKAGMWAAVALAVMCMFAGVLVFRRFVSRIVEPIAEIESVLDARRLGDPHRRCRPMDAPLEVSRIAASANEMLEKGEAIPRGDGEPSLAASDRAILLHLVDSLPDPVVIVGPEGETRARNAAAESIMEAAEEGDGTMEAIRAVAHGAGAGGAVARVTEIPGAGAWLCVLGKAA